MTPAHRRRILLVEDEAALAKMLTDYLEMAGYEVHTEGTGASALSDAALHRPDLVVLDLKLPDISGYEVCRMLRKLFQPWSVPIVIWTALAQPADQLRGFAHGADAYLTKPSDFGEIQRTIELLLQDTVQA